MIYFMQAPEGGPIKIGYSGDVQARRAQLESHYGRPLDVLRTMPGDRRGEVAMHAKFDHLRIGRTEQFRPGPDLLAFLGRPIIVGLNPDAVEAMSMSGNPGTVFALRGTEVWKEWLDEFATREGMPVTVLVDQALREMAKQRGFRIPPSRVP